MRRFVNHLLGLNNLRKFCGNAAVFGRFREKYRLKILSRPRSGRVLVLAPHPDDDVFGCGGSIAMHAKQEDQVKIIYFAGINKTKELKNLRTKEQAERQKMLSTRGREAQEATKVLKVSDIEFWGLRENKFVADKRNVERLKKVIKEYKPEIIYCPSFTDTNPDHYEVGKMLYLIMSDVKCQMSDVKILLYEVWTPIFVNRLIKIDSVIKQKKAAILCHQSQLKDRSYSDAILGLNKYRAGMFNAGKYAEGFWEMDGELCVKLFEKYQLK